ncbi:GNAT family N-acetyltransferase [Patescibacteria group bacterium]|nr:GNAT family N-acetyltransferase [Patescibacteria group bacterium]
MCPRNKKIESNEVEVREMELDDIPSVFSLGESLFTAEKWPTLYRTWDQYELVGFFESDGEFCFVAEFEDKIVGFILGTLIEKRRSAWIYGYVAWLGVSEKHKKMGIGSKLLKKLTEVFIENGARMMLVDTDPENENAIKFFKKNDFEHEVPHVYLSKNLSEHPKYIKKRKLNKKRRSLGKKRI